MKFNSLLQGLNILKKYMDDPEQYQTAAEHDEFYVQIDRAVSADDKRKLENLNWREDNSYSSSGLGWMCFT